MSESRIRDSLERQALLGDLAHPHRELLVASATLRTVGANEVLFRYGDPARHFYLLCSGRVTLEVPAIQGPNLEIQNLGAGEILGWSWLIAPYTWSFQARVEEEVELIEFDGEAIRERCDVDHDFGYAILSRFASLMSQRLEAARLEMMRQWDPPGFA